MQWSRISSTLLVTVVCFHLFRSRPGKLTSQTGRSSRHELQLGFSSKDLCWYPSTLDTFATHATHDQSNPTRLWVLPRRKLESAEARKERVAQEQELAKAIAEDGDDGDF